MRNFQDTFEICKRSFISAFSICRTVPLNFRPVTILPTFSKIFGKIITNYIIKSMDNYFSAYKAPYNTQVLLRLIEQWKANLDNIAEAAVMDLSRAFECIPYDLLIVNFWKTEQETPCKN